MKIDRLGFSFRLLPAVWSALFFLGAAQITSHAGTITLNPSADTSIMQKAAANNMGAGTSFAAGNVASLAPARGLVKFDLAGSLPAGSRITGASLQITVVKATALAEPATFNLHRLLVGWGEGTKNAGALEGVGAVATDGESSWNLRFAPSAAWSTSGGEAGADFETVFSATADIESGGVLSFESSSALVANIQHMLDNPAFNFGWLIKDQDEFSDITARRFGSREHPTDPPRLRVDFRPGLRIHRTEIVDGKFCLTFNTDARGYVVERRDKIESGEWTQISIVPAADVPGEFTVCDPFTDGNRFYRVREM